MNRGAARCNSDAARAARCSALGVTATLRGGQGAPHLGGVPWQKLPWAGQHLALDLTLHARKWQVSPRASRPSAVDQRGDPSVSATAD